MVKGKKVLVTGATGTIARPVAEHLAKANEVWCAGRFTDQAAKDELAALGIQTCPWDMGGGDWSGLPHDFTHVFHSAMHFGPSLEDHDTTIRLNAEAPALLMQHCRDAEAFVHVSTFCVYRRNSDHQHHAYAESDPLGCDISYSASYPASKLAAEATVRAAARMFDVPTTIARMNVGYSYIGGNGGLPVTYYRMMAAGEPIHVNAQYDEFCSPIGTHDLARQGEGLFAIASVPATIVNWAGDEPVSRRELCEYIGSLTGLTPCFEESPVWIELSISDNRKREALIGKCSMNWRDGIRELFEVRKDLFSAMPSKPTS